MPLKTVGTADCAAAFVAGWVSRFGVPAAMVSDRGVQFTSNLWAAVMQRLGVKHKMTTAFHPQANGLIEWFHRRLKEALKARAASADWAQHLPWVLLGLCTAPREESAVSSAELVYGAPLLLPGQFISIRQLQAGMPCAAPYTYPDKERTVTEPLEPSLWKADFVYVQSPPPATGLAPVFRGPFAVHKRSKKFFIIKVGGHFDAISTDRLKPHLGGSAVAATPPRHG
jgi:hypothetical protein